MISLNAKSVIPLNARHTAGESSEFRGQAALNWLALGLLLAAWNAADDGPSARPKPEHLRGYATVSVRAVARAAILTR
jgi:hypothetical protein